MLDRWERIENVSAPVGTMGAFLLLCMVKQSYFMEVTTMYENKFAVTCVMGNTETVLRYFDSKAAAIAYGEAEKHRLCGGGVLSCIQADFDESGNMKHNTCRVFDVWE